LRLPRLKEVRELHGWSQKKLAEESGVSRDSISNYETSQREAWPATARKLADALGVEIADLREHAREPAVPLAEAPREAGQPDTSARTAEEWERTLAYVMEPAFAEALREQQAANRFLSSEGRRQDRVVDPPEVEVANRFLNELSSEELPLAFGEVALGRARFERDNVNLREALTRRQDLLRERDEKLAQVEQDNARLKEENTRLREAAGQESAHR
jgi:transcriptional regulator with XRE-family HTH domain